MNYLLIGPEEYLKHQFLEKLKKSILNDNSTQLDFEVFQGGEIDVARISDSFNTLPFISKKRLIVIKQIDRFSSKEKDSILKHLKHIPQSTTLVLESSSSEFDKFLEKVSRFAKLIRCSKLKDPDLKRWIRSEFVDHRKKISPPGVDLIKELAGKDLFLLKNEIEKIVSFVGEEAEITECHIEMVLEKTAYKTAFELVDLVLEKRIDRVLISVDGLLQKEKPHQVLNILAWQFRNFIKIKNLPKNVSPEEFLYAAGINQRFIEKTLEQSKRFTQPELERNLEIILEADLFIKRGKMDSRVALERALVDLCR